MSDVLTKICADKREHVAAWKSATTRAALEERALAADAPRGFKAAIERKKGAAIISEIKKASPSKGVLRTDFQPALHAKQYEDAGAACLSVLTDTPYFHGHDDDLIAARAACALPVLRKDFMVDIWQVPEARALGADAILIIMAAVDDELAQGLYAVARDFNMDVLIEVHDRAELDRALALETPDALIGINNRNLKTLQVSLDTSLELIRAIPAARAKIAESGIHAKSDLEMLQNAGFTGFLIGEAFMTKPDPGAALLTFLKEQS